MEKVSEKTEALSARIGSWSKKLRAQGRPTEDRARWSQTALAQAAGVSRATLAALERGKASQGGLHPHFSVIVGIADALGLQVRDLLSLAQAPLDDAIPGTVKRVAQALNLSEQTVDAMRTQLAESPGQMEGMTRGAPVLRHAPPLPSQRLEGSVVDMESLAADLTALGRFSLSIAGRIARVHENDEATDPVSSGEGDA